MSGSGKRVAMVIAPNFEDVEATDPMQALEGAGATVTLIGIETGDVSGKKGATLEATRTFDDASPDEFDLLVIPGGGAPENLRIDNGAVSFTRQFMASGKPVAAICHGAQLLISAEAVRGRTLTAVNKIRDDIRNAGGNYVDEELVIDGNLITSRTPRDLPAFNDAIVAAVAEHAAVGESG